MLLRRGPRETNCFTTGLSTAFMLPMRMPARLAWPCLISRAVQAASCLTARVGRRLSQRQDQLAAAIPSRPPLPLLATEAGHTLPATRPATVRFAPKQTLSILAPDA